MKIYISQPYAYKSDEEIVKVRNDIIKELHAYMKDIEILDSVIQIEQTFGLKQLSESILVLSDADAIIFAPGLLSLHQAGRNLVAAALNI